MKVFAEASKHQQELLISAITNGVVGYLVIDGGIDDWGENNSSLFRKNVNSLKSNGAKTVELKLNTKGGDVFAAREIVNILTDTFEADNVKVRIGALAASAGTYITSKFYTTAKYNSQLMIHKPSTVIAGNEDDIESSLKLLRDATKDYIEAYVLKTGKSEAEIKALFDKGDYWMTAKEALKEGFIDEIENQPAKITQSTKAMLVACGAPKILTVTKTTNIKNMDKELLIASLGLPADATEAQILAKINELKISAQSVADIKAEAARKEKEAKQANIKALLDAAEKDKKFEAKLRPHYEKMLEADFDSTKAVIDAMPSIGGAPSNDIESNTAAAGVAAKHKGWTYEDFAEKDPEAFKKLPEATQKKLIDAHFTDAPAA